MLPHATDSISHMYDISSNAISYWRLCILSPTDEITTVYLWHADELPSHPYGVATLYLYIAAISCGRLTNSSRTTWLHSMEVLPHYWPFVRGIHQRPVDNLHKGPVMCSFGFFFIFMQNEHGWTNTRVATDMRHHDAQVTSLWWNMCAVISY